MSDQLLDAETSLYKSLVEELGGAVSHRKLDLYDGIAADGHEGGPYVWQERFHEAGSEYKERSICAANRSGKTRSAAAEIAIHVTGRYPPWWKGRRFTRPIEVWIGSETNEASRDIVQKELLGGIGNELGTGWIPGDALTSAGPSTRQAGISGVVDSVKVNHLSGGLSTIGFKTYDQKRERWQGTSKDIVWFDEEPPQDIYTEGQTRTIDRNGMIMLTFTPLQGVSDVVRKYLAGGIGIWMVGATWDDAPHLSEDDKAQMVASYPEHERGARTRGEPMMGIGAIFPFDDHLMMINPLKIQDHWRCICGIDFGINHPAAAVWLAYDADTDIIYIYDCYRKAGEGAPYHAQRIMSGQRAWIPCAWPHDGMNREKSGGKPLADSFREAGVNMLPISARYDEDTGGAQPIEPGIDLIYNRMRSGGIKVFSNLQEWFEEKHFYHRDKNGKVVSEHDDIMSATRYGVMMLRYAMSRSQSDAFEDNAGVTTKRYDPMSFFN